MIHHQAHHKTIGIHHNDALVFLDVLSDLLLKPAQGGDRFPSPGEDVFAAGARRIAIAVFFVLRAGLELLDDFFV